MSVRLLLAVCSIAAASDSAESQDRAVPHLIAAQGPQLGAAWKEVENLIEENERLPLRSPDPYIARAEVWTAAGSHEDALEDYLRASRLMLAGSPTLVEKSRLLDSLLLSMDRLSRQPKPMYPLEADQAFEGGLDLFYKGYFAAAAPLFAEATRLNPDNAVYRVVRALNHRKLGEESSAKRQLAAAAAVLNARDFSEFRRVRFYQRLERIQGPDRQWITAGLRYAAVSAQHPGSPRVASLEDAVGMLP
jgi:hypothetical protein